MPSYNQLAASSLLNQQYVTALGLGEEMVKAGRWTVLFGWDAPTRIKLIRANPQKNHLTG